MMRQDSWQVSPQEHAHGLLGRRRGGVAPSRHDLALAIYLETQRARHRSGRRAVATAALFWRALMETCRTALGDLMPAGQRRAGSRSG